MGIFKRYLLIHNTGINREKLNLFLFSVDDRLHSRIQDGVRYEREKVHKKKIQHGIAGKRAANKDNDEAATTAKRAKATYMVNSVKFASKATEEQLAQELTKADLGTEETHKILQCKIR